MHQSQKEWDKLKVIEELKSHIINVILICIWGGLRYNCGPCLVSRYTQGWLFYALGSYQR